MTARAKDVTLRATTGPPPPPTQPARDLRAFVDAFERLRYDGDDLLRAAGLTRRDLDDPDAQVPCTVMGALARTSA